MKAVGSQKAFKLEGVPQMKKTLLEIRKVLNAEGNAALADELKQVLLGPAEFIAEDARDLAPQGETGLLKKSIHTGTGKGASAWVAVDLKVAPYAAFVERGTSKMAAQPFFRPAVAAARPMTARMLAEKIPAILESAAEREAWRASGF